MLRRFQDQCDAIDQKVADGEMDLYDGYEAKFRIKLHADMVCRARHLWTRTTNPYGGSSCSLCDGNTAPAVARTELPRVVGDHLLSRPVEAPSPSPLGPPTFWATEKPGLWLRARSWVKRHFGL